MDTGTTLNSKAYVVAQRNLDNHPQRTSSWLSLVVAIGFCLFGQFVEAQWTNHGGYPAWCHRGAVRWTHGFVTWTPKHVETILDMGFNLVQSGYWPERPNEPPLPASRFFDVVRKPPIRWRVLAYREATAKGFRWQKYTDSHALDRDAVRRHPELKECLILLKNGQPRFEYGNPDRLGGCWSQERYLEYKLDVLKRIRRRYSPLETVFMDNASPRPCYCKACRAKFREFSKAALGHELSVDDALAKRQHRDVWRMFMVEMGQRFYERCKQESGFLISPNFHFSPWHFAMIERGVPDLIFFEEGNRFPPFADSTFYYKTAIALSRGKVVGVMLGFPDDMAEQRALRRGKYWETGHPIVTEAFYYPDEWALALAEGAACDGCWIPSWNIREQKISLANDSYHTALRDTLRRHNHFMMRYEDMYRDALPLSNIAVLYSTTTAIKKGLEYMRWVESECRSLVAAGLPYEVIGEADLKLEALRQWDAVVIPACEYLPLEKCRVLSSYLRSGGGLTLIGDVGLYGPYGLPHNAALPPEFTRGLKSDKSSTRQIEPRGGAHMPLEQVAVAESRESWSEGKLWRIPSLRGLTPDKVRSALEWLTGGLVVEASPSTKLFINAMQTEKWQTVHFVNYDFRYAKEKIETAAIADDDGKGEARTYLLKYNWRVRKILNVSDTTAFKKAYIQFKGGTWGGKQFTVHLLFNGHELTIPGSYFTGMRWHEIELESPRVRDINTIDMFLTGETDSRINYLNIRLDTGAPGERSFWSTDSGKTWQQDDLSPDRGKQHGEYMIRLSPISFHRNYKPGDLKGKLEVVSARNVTVTIADSISHGRTATLLTRDGAATMVEPKRRQGKWDYSIPEVSIYAVLRIAR